MRPSARRRAGFTLVETLVALAVASITLAVAASALLSSLRAEDVARVISGLLPAAETVMARQARGVAAENLGEGFGERWLVETAAGEAGQARWLACTLSPRERPSLRLQMRFQTR